MMGVATFLITLQFNYIYCTCLGKVKCPLLCFDSSVFRVNQVFIVLKPCIICTFLVNSDSVKKMLTALFKFV